MKQETQTAYKAGKSTGHHTWLFEWIFKYIQPIKPQDLIAVLVINQRQLWRVHLDIHCNLSMAGVITLDTFPPFQQFAADWVKTHPIRIQENKAQKELS